MDLFFFIKKKEKIPLKTSFDSSAWWYGLLRLYFLRQDYKPSKRLFVVVTQNSKHLEKFQKPIENIKSQQAWRFIAKFNEFKKLYYHTRKERRKKMVDFSQRFTCCLFTVFSKLFKSQVQAKESEKTAQFVWQLFSHGLVKVLDGNSAGRGRNPLDKTIVTPCHCYLPNVSYVFFFSREVGKAAMISFGGKWSTTHKKTWSQWPSIDSSNNCLGQGYSFPRPICWI